MYSVMKNLFKLYKDFCNFSSRMILTNGIKKIHALPQGVVLDVGCGHKPYKNYFSGNISKYVGLDLDSHQEVDVVGNAIYLPILDNSIDTVLCFNALNVFRNPFMFFREANRVLKSDGYLIITTGFMYPIWCEGYDCWRATKFGLKVMAEDNGFVIDKIVPLGEGFWITSAISFKQYIFSMLSDGIKVFLKPSNENWHIGLKKIISTIVVIPFTPLLPITTNLFVVIALFLDKIFPSDKHAVYYLLIAQKR
ncbi:hypothetical protein JCM12298_29510 [Desulfothermus naphthae]